MERAIDQNLIFNQIRKYNQAQSQTRKAAALKQVGVHVGLLNKEKRDLTNEQRQMMIYFLNQFCAYQGVPLVIS
ncbi:hypothetical protein NDI44_08590 [Trichocoleus sp. DQ-A3]|uniref:hypothetical protein n=1 Tax=Cyanophyceae TaxID=3028117 RepID=UPI00168649B0|nr:hypothetical protein [Coleofasciculus sp. FACHB-125]MBD1899248.1 hypothetical protein [Coleofasciculus sp. FACHB-125]